MAVTMPIPPPPGIVLPCVLWDPPAEMMFRATTTDHTKSFCTLGMFFTTLKMAVVALWWSNSSTSFPRLWRAVYFAANSNVLSRAHSLSLPASVEFSSLLLMLLLVADGVRGDTEVNAASFWHSLMLATSWAEHSDGNFSKTFPNNTPSCGNISFGALIATVTRGGKHGVSVLSVNN